jgi:ATP-dependent DNA helicase RecG
MTEVQLRKLAASGETLDVEFKGEEREALNDNDLVETVVCLSNRSSANPGWLLVGVEHDGRVTGARPRREGQRTDVHMVQALIANRTRPPVAAKAELVRCGLVDVLTIEVPPGPRVTGTSDAKYVRRTIGGDGKPACVPYYHDETVSRLADTGEMDYSAFEVRDAEWKDLEPLEFDRFRRTVRESKGAGDSSLVDLTDLELARALGAVVDRAGRAAPRVAGLLLFGSEEAIRSRLPGHEVAFQVLTGTKVLVNDFFHWPLLRLMDELLTRFRARYQEEELIEGMVRVAVPNFSERAFREAVANALIHRDYTRLGAVHIQWLEDRLEISDPGGFPGGVRLDNLLVTAPRPRNLLLADAFKRAGVVDRAGRGIDTMFLEPLRNGRPGPSYDRTTSSAVTVVLPGSNPLWGSFVL